MNDTKCKCGCGMDIKPEMKFMLESIERDMKAKRGDEYQLFITSGARCDKYNATIPGSKPNDAHTLGLAADIRVQDSNEAYLILSLSLSRGIKRIGNGQNKGYFHIDIAQDERFQKFVIWHY